MKKINTLFAFLFLIFYTCIGAQTFDTDLHRKNIHGDVLRLQQYLNKQGFILAENGPGSPGNETNYFGPRTQRALTTFQNHYAAQILHPLSLFLGTGNFFTLTRSFINSQFLAPVPLEHETLITNVVPPIVPIATSYKKQENVPIFTYRGVGVIGGGGGSILSNPSLSFHDITKVYSTLPFQLVFNSNSNGATTFTSSNPSIASIAGDIVTLHNIGSVTITATQSATSGYREATATATLEINDSNACSGNPCENGGSCTNVPPGDFSCSCINGYTGDTCENDPTYSVGGTAAGITNTVVLQNNGGDDLSITTNGSFSFSTFLNNAVTYLISIFSSLDQVCSLSNTAGTISGSNITNILLNCLVRPTITGFSNITNNAATGTPTYTLPTPTSNSAGAFTYSIENTSIGTIAGNILTVHGRGITTLTATQAANGIYAAGTINATLTMLVADACAANPCGANGTCTRTTSPPGGFLDSYSCTCASGYYGATCSFIDNSADQCLAAPCQNGGTCTRTSTLPAGPLDSFTCSCEGTGFSGELCELSDANCSDPGYCLNGGTCSASPTGGECACSACFTGPQCAEYDDVECPLA